MASTNISESTERETTNGSPLPDSNGAFPLLEQRSQEVWTPVEQGEGHSIGEESTDTYAMIPSDASTSERHSDERYGPRESLLVADSPLQWLMLVASCRGAYELEFLDHAAGSTMRAYVLDGRICAGMTSDNSPHVDATFRARAPEVAEAYLQECHRRTSDAADILAPSILDTSAIPATPHTRSLFARQIMDVFQRAAGQVVTRRRIKCETVNVKHPLMFSPVELGTAAHQTQEDPFLARFRADFDRESYVELTSRWVFGLDEQRGDCSQLVSTDSPGMRSLAEMAQASSHAQSHAALADVGPSSFSQSITHAMGFDEDDVWLFVRHGDQVLLQRHDVRLAGPVKNVAARLLGGDE